MVYLAEAEAATPAHPIAKPLSDGVLRLFRKST
jgi:hypothetical protein